MIWILLKKDRLTGIEKHALAKIMTRLIPALIHYNKYLREFKEVIDLENKITFK
ncbi:MAG: hypothetical protein KJ706_04330 [Candidatus Omnitrophica bacterium]|nr:hypothetical protein [Candidatus Omnitrophota bacterium]